MNQIEHNRKLGEILRQAREALNEELLAKQTSAYQIWLDSCNLSWRNKGTLLPPNSVKLVYPTEKDIVNRALEIYNALNPRPEILTPVVPEQVIVEPVINEVTEQVADEPTPAAIPLISEDAASDDAVIKDKFASLLTKWGGQGHY